MRLMATFAMFAVLVLMPGASAFGADAMRSKFPVRTDHHHCQDVRGAQVATIRFDGLRDVAHAVIMNHVPYIVLNPTRLATLPPKLQVFFYEHECAHHMLGHNYNPTLSSEAEADCLAVKVARSKGLLNRKDVIAFGPWINPLLGSSRGHLPGKKRQSLILECFDDAERDLTMAERMKAALTAFARLQKPARLSRKK